MSGRWWGEQNRCRVQSQPWNNEQKQGQCAMQDAKLSGRHSGARNLKRKQDLNTGNVITYERMQEFKQGTEESVNNTTDRT